MRLDQGHALDIIPRPATRGSHRLKYVPPPQSFFRRLGFRNIETKRMLQFSGIDAINDSGDVEQRGWRGFVKNSCLVNVQSTGADPNDDGAGLDSHDTVALLVRVSQGAAKRSQDVLDPEPLVFPLVDRRVF